MKRLLHHKTIIQAARMLVVVAAMVTAKCVAQPNWSGAGAIISKATVMHYAPRETKPLLTLRSDRIYGDYQKRGFFRIGVLPMVVVDGLEVKLHDASRSLTALTNAPYLLGKHINPKGALEIRRFSLQLPEPRRIVLKAQSVRVVKGDIWNLNKGVFSLPDGTDVAFQRASLTVAGVRAGEIVYETTNGCIRELVQFTALRPPNATANP